MNNQLTNGGIWNDSSGNLIHAHGGHMLFHDDYYYWYGEDRRDDIYVSCYRSKDLFNWEFRNHILTTSTPAAPIRVRTNLALVNDKGGKVNLERPKVLFNAVTKKFVLWVHYENGENYNDAACAIATSDYPDSHFVYHGSFNPYGYMSRDCTLFQDDDGTAYFISAARDNADLHIYRLQEDYLNVESLVGKPWQGEYREAPTVFKRKGKYYMVTSFCTGWAPNQGKYAMANTMDGPWGILSDFGDETTFRTQPAFVLKRSEEDYLYFSDRWNGSDYFQSSYEVLPIEFNGDIPILDEYSTLSLREDAHLIHFER
ncbi:family 43 glycosylhydrolase [Paenibacillus sp. CFBP 13594]|uniref:family 43 glycosylhydrolase n=1 Tax=Paenibacillus sp. CFBP 13594 TaxID=2774037 RepID=UPI001782D043|nr:family 43 glycosylhydrolase [Paenibacillus sp. CFBP 13594]